MAAVEITEPAKRGALKKELIKHLRTQRTMRRSRHGNRSGEGQGQIKDMISISELPALVEDRAVIGFDLTVLAQAKRPFP